MAGRIYTLSDIHGNFDLLLLMLKKIDFKDEDTLYILGDICDRGEDSLNAYFYINKFKNIHLIKGNHEYMMEESLKQSLELDDFDPNTPAFNLWVQNGGTATINNFRDYLRKQKLMHLDYNIVKTVFLKMMIDYLSNLPLYKEITVDGRDFILVHAGVCPDTALQNQSVDTLVWIRDYFYLSECDPTKTYIFGHTPTGFLNRDHTFHIWHDDQFHNKYGIDGGLAVGRKVGQLNCLCLNDFKEYKIKVGEDL
ncbi:MAG: metallophosphoesterase [Thomasclavelia sp.]|nr:metallophosphoesterase [Thomasclavelia sp.]